MEKIFDDLDIVSIRMTKKGYGFVEFEAEDDVMQAVELDGTTVGGRVIKVNRDDRKNNFATTRGKGRKGFSKRGYQKKVCMKSIVIVWLCYLTRLFQNSARKFSRK